MAARLTRAKRTIHRSGARSVVPEGAELPSRLESICRVIYLAFTVGYAPVSAAEVTRVEVPAEAIRLARLLRELLPGRSELDALLALMLLQHSRRDARIDESGRLVLLPNQDRSSWHHDEITEGLALLQPMMSAQWSGTAAGYFLQGSDRGGARGRGPGRGHPLGSDRRPLRRAGAADRLAGGSPQPGSCCGGGRGSRGRTEVAGGSGGLPAAEPSAGRCPRCPARRSRRAGFGAAGVPAGARAVRQRGGGRASADSNQPTD